MKSVSTPAVASAMAATRPAGPPPMTATSAVNASLMPFTPLICDRKSSKVREIAHVSPSFLPRLRGRVGRGLSLDNGPDQVTRKGLGTAHGGVCGPHLHRQRRGLRALGVDRGCKRGLAKDVRLARHRADHR